MLDGLSISVLLIIVAGLGVVAQSPNNPPTFLHKGTVDVVEDQGAVQIVDWVYAVHLGLNDDPQLLSWIVTNTNEALFDVQPHILWNSSFPSVGILAFTLKANAFGAADVTVKARDNGGGSTDTSEAATFALNVVGVNDPPLFTAGPGVVTVDEDAGVVTINNWATSISAGSLEASQSVVFNLQFVDMQNATLFSAPPAISLTGTLSFTPAANQNTFAGRCELYVQLVDDGGGPAHSDRSCHPITSCGKLEIVITSVNDPPTFNATTGAIELWEDLGNLPGHGVDLCYEHPNFAVAVSHGAGPSEIGQHVSFSVSVDSTSIFRVLPSVHLNGSMIFCLREHSNGIAQVTVTARDSGPSPNEGRVAVVSVTVLSVNDAPVYVMGGVTVVALSRNAAGVNYSSFLTGVMPAVAAAADEHSTQVVSVAVTCNPAALLNRVEVSRAGGVVALFLQVERHSFGNGTLIFTLNDGGGTLRGGVDSVTFAVPLVVAFVSNAPTIDLASDLINVTQSTAVSNGSGVVKYVFLSFASNITAGVSDEGVESVSLTVTSTAASIYGIDIVSGALVFFTPGTFSGTAFLTFSVTDSAALTTTRIVQVVIRPVHLCPTFAIPGDVTALEDGGTISLPFFFTNVSRGSAAEDGQALTWHVDSISALFDSVPVVNYVAAQRATANMSLRVKADVWGSIPVRVTLSDDGSTADGGCVSSSQNFTVHVIPVNDRPSFSVPQPLVRVNEDVGLVVVPGFAQNVTAGAREQHQLVNFNLTLLDDTQRWLFDSLPFVSASGDLTFRTAADRNTFNGTVQFKLQLVDDDGSVTSASCDFALCPVYVIEVLPVNDLPHFLEGADIMVWEDLLNIAPAPVDRTLIVPNWAMSVTVGAALEEFEGQRVSFVVVSNDTSLFFGAPVVHPNGTLAFTLQQHYNGIANVTVTIVDNGPAPNVGKSAWLLVVVLPVNDVPTMNFASQQTLVMNENAPLLTFAAFGIGVWPGPQGIPDESLQLLSVTALPNPSDLFATVSMSAAGGVAALSIRPTPRRFGNATCFVTLKDTGGVDRGGIDTLVLNFSIQVQDINDPPTLDLNRTLISILEDAYPQGFTLIDFATNISSSPFERDFQGYDIVVTNTNPGLFLSQPRVDNFGTLFFTVRPDQFGDANAYIAITDHGTPPITMNRTFVIAVTSVNDCPSFQHLGTIRVNESSAVLSYLGWAYNVRRGPTNEDAQQLTWKITTNNDQLFDVLPVISNAAGSNGTLVFRPKPELSGIVSVSVVLQDDGGTSSGGCDQSPAANFLIIVDAVNQNPIFVMSRQVVEVNEDAGAVSFTSWASGISAGASNEAQQALWFVLTFMNASQAAIFKTIPRVDSVTGSLTFEVHPNMNTIAGTVRLYVQLFDNGGVPPAASCAPVTTCGVLEIVVHPINDPPVFTAAMTEIILWEDMGNFIPAPQSLTRDYQYALSISPGNDVELLAERQNVSFALVASDLSMFAVPPVLFSNGTLRLQLTPNKNGVSTLQIQIRDDGPSPNVGSSQSLRITVLDVNDAPSLVVAMPIVSVVEDSGATSVSSVFASIFPGPPDADDEANQQLSYAVSVHNSTVTPLFINTPTFDISIPASPRLVFQPRADTAGRATLRVTVSDNGGILRNGADFSTYFITVEIVEVNDPPSFSLSVVNLALNEDATAQVFPSVITAVSAGPNENTVQSVSFNVIVSSPALFSEVPYVAPNGTLFFTPAPHAFGTSFVDISVTDTGSPPLSSAQSRLMITLNSVNDAPTFQTISMINITACTLPAECLITVPGFIIAASAGPLNEAQGLSFSFSLSTVAAALFDRVPQVLPDNSLTFTIKSDVHTYYNPVVIGITAEDVDGTANGGVNSATRSFLLNIVPQIAAPSFDPPSSLSLDVREDTSLVVVEPFASNIRRSGFPTNVLVFITETLQPHLFARQPTVMMNTDGTAGTLTFQPAANLFGSANLYVRIYDPDTKKNGTNAAFTVNILAVNDPPSFDVADVEVYEDSGASLHRVIYNLSVGMSEADLIISAMVVCADEALFKTRPLLTSDGILSVDLQPQRSGSTPCTVTLQDSGGTANGGVDRASKLLYVRVRRFNRAPTFTAGGDVTVLEDGTEYSSVWATSISAGVGELTQSVQFSLSCSNEELFFAPPSLATSGMLRFRPNPNLFGASTCVVQLTDDGPGVPPNSNRSGAISFAINVVPVNDAPSFSRGADIQGKADEGLLRVANWATGITAGPPNEQQQILTLFSRNPSRPYAFARIPALEFASATAANFVVELNVSFSGFVTVEMCVRDNGGTENGGVDTACYTVSISVIAATPRPEFSFLSLVEVREDSPAVVVPNWVTSLHPLDIVIRVNCSVNTILTSQPHIAARRDLLLTPAQDQFGTVPCSLVGEASGFTKREDFVVSVVPVNDAPTFTTVTNAISVGQGETINVSVATAISPGPPNEAHQRTHFAVSFAPQFASFFVGDVAVSAEGVMYLTASPDSPAGNAIINFILVDDGGTANGGVNTSSVAALVVRVEFRNRPPSFFIQSPTISIMESDERYVFPAWIGAVSPGSPLETTQTVTFTMTLSNPRLFLRPPQLNASNSYELSFTLAPHAFGDCIVNVTGTDSLGAFGVAFATFTAVNVNDAPSFAHQGNVSIAEDTIRVVSRWASAITMGPFEDGVQQGVFSVTGFDTTLLQSVTVELSSGNLIIVPVPDAFGSSLAIVTLQDNGGVAFGGVDTFRTTVRVTVEPVNDPPVLEIQGSVTIGSVMSEQQISVPGWIVRAAPGPPSEIAQRLTIAVTVDNVTLFDTQPRVDLASSALIMSFSRAGSTAATITATDGEGLQVTHAFNITVESVTISLAFSPLLSTLTVEAGSAVEVPFVDVTSASRHIVRYDVTIGESAGIFAVAPTVTPGGVLTFRTTYRNGAVRIAVEAVGAGGLLRGTPVTILLTVRIPTALRATLAAPLEAFDEEYFKRVIAAHANVTVAQVVIVQVRAGSTVVDFYIKGLDWPFVAPALVADLLNVQGTLSVLLGVQSAVIVEMPLVLVPPASLSPTQLLPGPPGSPPPSSSATVAPPSPTPSPGTGIVPQSPPFKRSDGWLQLGIYVFAAVTGLAIAAVAFTCFFVQRSKRVMKMRLRALQKASDFSNGIPPTAVDSENRCHHHHVVVPAASHPDQL